MSSQNNQTMVSSKRVGANFARTFAATIHKITQGFMWVGACVLVALVLLITTHVIGRYFLRASVKGAVELAELAMVVMVFAGMAYVTFRRGHVDVVLLVSRFPKRAQWIIYAIMTLVAAGISAILSWQLGLAGLDLVTHGSYTSVLNIPHCPFYFVAAIGAGIVCLELLIGFLRILSERS